MCLLIDTSVVRFGGYVKIVIRLAYYGVYLKFFAYF